jgi:hypothetical protein
MKWLSLKASTGLANAILPFLVLLLLLLLGVGNLRMYQLAWNAQQDVSKIKDLAIYNWREVAELDKRVHQLDEIRRLEADVAVLKEQNKTILLENVQIRRVYLQDLAAQLSAKQAAERRSRKP